MKKGRKGTYREFEAHEAEVTFKNDMTMTKKRKNRKKLKKEGEGKGEICTKCTKPGY